MDIVEKSRKSLGGIEGELADIMTRIEDKINELDLKEKHWADLEAKVTKCIEDAPNRIVLDVGGTKFAASKETFLSQKGTFFECMLSGNWKPDASGKYYIDRNPECFPIIMQYLRTGTVDLQGYPSNMREKLLVELDFYQVNIPQLHPTPTMMFNQSVLLSESHKTILSEWMGDKHTTLLYRATRDGMHAGSFHRLCDHKGPTLVVVSDNSGYIYGGFTSAAWDSSIRGFHAATECFLFTLSNPHGIPPSKFLPHIRNQAIYSDMSVGPFFGNHDMVIFGLFNNKSFSRFPFSYIDTTGKGRLLFTGDERLHPKEIEVFLIPN